MNNIKKILVANRGEIAVRIIRTAKRMGIECVAIYDEIEKDAYHVKIANESYSLGSGNLSNTYLNIEKILNIAKKNDCDAIHPGYGFLSENESFALACQKAGFRFIGPDSKSIQLMGNKIEARKYIESIGVPTTKGLTGTVSELLKKAEEMPYPVLVKAAAGGGGKGMKIVHSASQLNEALESASREAKSYFGNDAVYIEQYIENPRHIEVQILGDEHGNVVHLFERECSIQRRYQKIIEEAPSATLNSEVRKKICDSAVLIGKALDYKSAGTIEYLVDKDLNFHFLEMNTRIQVEHPVTELITSIDIVEQQINIANQYKLAFNQNNIQLNGHAIECRIYAEDALNDFRPSPGYINHYREPGMVDARIDSGINSANEIHPNFDPMISKLIAKGNNRNEAIKNIADNLLKYKIHGITTNIPYILSILQNQDYLKNNISTQFIDNKHGNIVEALSKQLLQIQKTIPISGFLLYLFNRKEKHDNIWQKVGLWRDMLDLSITVNKENIQLENIKHFKNVLKFTINGEIYNVKLVNKVFNNIQFELNGIEYTTEVSSENEREYFCSYMGHVFSIERNDVMLQSDFYEKHQKEDTALQNLIFAPMPGKIIKIDVEEGETILKGANLIVIEAMKMENTITAPRNGMIKKLNVKLNDSVSATNTLLEIV